MNCRHQASTQGRSQNLIRRLLSRSSRSPNSHTRRRLKISSARALKISQPPPSNPLTPISPFSGFKFHRKNKNFLDLDGRPPQTRGRATPSRLGGRPPPHPGRQAAMPPRAAPRGPAACCCSARS